MTKLKKTGFRITFEDGETRTIYLQPIANKKCSIRFEADKSDIINGIFGFDEIPYNDKSPEKRTKKLSEICFSDIHKLKDEYIPITVEGKEYLAPWISIRKDQTITLDVILKIKKEEEYQSIVFEEHPDFTIIPIDKKGTKVDLKKAKKIKITCNNTNQKTVQIKIIADEKEAGAINFWYPKPKTIDLKWYFIELTGNDKDNDDLKHKIDRSKLEALLKKGLNPALIDVNILNKNAEIIDMTEYAS